MKKSLLFGGGCRWLNWLTSRPALVKNAKQRCAYLIEQTLFWKPLLHEGLQTGSILDINSDLLNYRALADQILFSFIRHVNGSVDPAERR